MYAHSLVAAAVSCLPGSSQSASGTNASEWLPGRGPEAGITRPASAQPEALRQPWSQGAVNCSAICATCHSRRRPGLLAGAAASPPAASPPALASGEAAGGAVGEAIGAGAGAGAGEGEGDGTGDGDKDSTGLGLAAVAAFLRTQRVPEPDGMQR
jgi:hypothetical protein